MQLDDLEIGDNYRVTLRSIDDTQYVGRFLGWVLRGKGCEPAIKFSITEFDGNMPSTVVQIDWHVTEIRNVVRE